jgi:dihydrofolate reductase
VKASVFVGVSVDGFLARPDHTFDFLPAEPEEHGYDQFFASVDAMVIGRNTYEVVLGFGGWAYGKKPVFVLSTHRLKPAPETAVVERLSGAPDRIWKKLEARGFRHLYVDGGMTIQRFLRAGLIQRLVITRVPVLIGEGIPLFGPTGRDIALKHVATRQVAGGLVQSEYEVTAHM